MLTTAPFLADFNPSRPTVVEDDSSSYGIGGCFLQEFNDGLKPIAYCSRTLTNAEQKYAQIEKECLASVWACERFDRYLMGLNSFTLFTDHKPLVPLMNSKDLSETSIRCQRMLIRLMRYKPKAEYRPGPTMVTSDTRSRCLTSTSSRNLEVE
ncbi:Pol polyprotein [Plakobranchus ocellatus]|uniref:Pol polyprotein n=1 Tax=Plakobranchus ocellatus TaxID=259542 RepID=A0AAV4A517_9GAST|nr:Pol polyprotein [Plakobranchus ocellatus]